MQRLNIGLVTPGFSANESDWCVPALLNLVRRLATDHDVTVYSLRYPHVDRTYNVYGARVRAFGGATVGGWQRLPLLWRATNRIADDARKKPFSLLHALWADEAGFVATMAARRIGAPSLVSLLGGELVRLPEINYGVQLSRSGRFLTDLSLRLANIISAGSQQLLDTVSRRVAPQRLRLLPLGVDLAMFRPAVAPLLATASAAPPPPYRIVHAASFSTVKDQATLLRAFALARDRLTPLELSLHLAGDGPLRSALQTQARKLGIAAVVHFHGDLPHDRLPDFYRSGHLFALSSLYESQSMVLLEAAACGLPAVGTSVGLLPELLPATYLAETGDADSLARAIIALLSDETRRQTEGRRLQSLVSSNYSLDQTVPRLIDAYHDLLSPRPQFPT